MSKVTYEVLLSSTTNPAIDTVSGKNIDCERFIISEDELKAEDKMGRRMEATGIALERQRAINKNGENGTLISLAIKGRDIPATNEIQAFFHCSKCIEQYEKEKPDMSRSEFQQIVVGYSLMGFQVWCRRHECNILHMDLQGMLHPANLSGDVTP